MQPFPSSRSSLSTRPGPQQPGRRRPGTAACVPDVASNDAGDRPQLRRRCSTVAAQRFCQLAREITGAVFAVPVSDIEQPTRATIEASDARHVAMYIAHVVFQVSLAAVAGAFGRDRSSVGYAVRRIEDERDDAAFDAKIERIERLAHAVRQAVDACIDGTGPGNVDAGRRH